jgi:hypothetical protein
MESSQRLFLWIWILGFIAFMIVPSFGILMEPDELAFSEIELRKPNPFPAKSDFIPGFESWFNDRVLFRFALTQGLSRLYYVLGDSMITNQVQIGQKGWLFLGNRHARTINQYRGLFPPTERQMKNAAWYFLSMKSMTQSRGIPFIACVTPSKNRIYSEYLPPWIKGSKEPSRLQMYRERLAESGMDLIDLTPEMLEAKKKHYPVYLQTDSHWNGAGAYYAYVRILQALRVYLPDLHGLDQAPVTFHNRKVLGDMARMLQLPLYSDDIYVTPSEGAMAPIKRLDGMIYKNVDPSAIVATPREPLLFVNTSLPKGPRLLFLRDSFGMSLSPYIHQSFGEVVETHYLHGKQSLETLLNKYNPDIVLLELTERALVLPFPEELIKEKT